MAPESATYVWDALTAAERAVRFVQGKTFQNYLADELLRSAVERQLEIVGEALNQLRKIDQHTAHGIPELSQAVGMRNILIHGYASVDDRLVWDVATAHLAPLIARLRPLLSSV
jgi:uncharacterized protein with HEPN domain